MKLVPGRIEFLVLCVLGLLHESSGPIWSANEANLLKTKTRVHQHQVTVKLGFKEQGLP